MESFISNTVKVKCAFCQLEVYRKNYKTHLKRKHPGKKDDNLCGFGQKKVSDFFGKGGEQSEEEDGGIGEEGYLTGDTIAKPVDSGGVNLAGTSYGLE